MSLKRTWLVALLLFQPLVAQADKVIMKDGAVFTGKIVAESKRVLLIGNPPFDPIYHFLKTEDIETIVREPYHMSPPSERRRGPVLVTNLMGLVSSSVELPLHPAPGLSIGGGYRIHPLLEIDGSFQWVPYASSRSGPLTISNGVVTRGYEDFGMHTFTVAGRIYPFFDKTTWKMEPFLTGGYGWSRLAPTGTDDVFKGSGWHAGWGAIYPLTAHLFAEGVLLYQSLSFDTARFLGTEGVISPAVAEHQYISSIGLSYRF